MQKSFSTEKPIQSGVIFQKNESSGLTEVQYEIRILDPSYLPRIMELQQLIIENLLNKDTLQPFPADFMKEHLGRKGFVLGVLSGNDLLAFRNVYFPDINDTEWNLGIDLEFPSRILNKVANLQMVCVHPSCRGNSIATTMNRHAIRIIKELGIRDHVCATVSPYNFWNIKILLACGFIIKKLTKKYGGKLRYVVHQDLHCPMSFESGSSQPVVLTNFIKQHEMLSNGWYGTNLNVSREDAGRPFYENMLLTFSRQTEPLNAG
ncbi:MAG: GNAT family N-acetyltransferase [Pseudomonadota bacterium]